MKGLLAWLVLYLQILLIRSKGICPGDLVPCSGSCTEQLSSNAQHSSGERSCNQRSMRLFQGLREGGDVEASCRDALPRDRYVWTRYKISSGRTVDETGTHVQNLDWDLEYCVTMRNTQQFAPRSCSWAAFRAVCVTPDAPISQSDASRCEREWYHVSAQNYNFKDAYNYCRRNDMNLAVPASASRINCLKSVIKTKSDDAWIDYKIREATFPIDPWDENYCVKIDVANRYTIDRCQMQLPIVCGSFGELEVHGGVVMKGNEGVLTCKCTDCQPSQVEWTDGLSTWHSNTNYHDKEVVTLCPGGEDCTSTLTIKEAPADQVYSCVQRIQGGSIVYGAAKLDVYDLTPSEHYITAGAMITMTCSFFNEEHNGVQRVDWIDQRDRNNITRMKKEEWQGQMVTSYVEILREEYTHNVSCNFITDLGNFAGMVQIIIYEIRARDVEVPADTVATLRCELEIGQGSVQTGVSPTSTYWEQGKRTYTSESALPYMALLNKEMRLGKDLWACHFRFKNGDLISKNIWVNAFELSGLSGDVARYETGYLTCTYSKGKLYKSLFWEREGVRVLNDASFGGETFKITGNSRNDSFYQAFTNIEIQNARHSANFSCCVEFHDGPVFRRVMHLNVYPGNFLANNITITEVAHSGEIVITCTVSAFPPPFITVVVTGAENKLLEGTTSNLPYNVSIHITTYPRTCDKVSFKCAATNKVITRTVIAESDLGRACGIFAKVSLMIWGIIAGVIFVLVILIVLVCCCCCRRNRKLKEEVVSQREILSNVYKTNVGGSVHYGQNIASSRMMLPSHDIPYSDYYESGKDYDDVNRKGIIEDDDLIMAKDFPKNQPLLSPRFDRDPIFIKRSQSRGELQQMFSPQLEKKMREPTLSYQNLRNAQHTPSYRSEASFVKPGKRSNSTHSLTKDDFQMNPYGKFQRLKNEESDFDMDEEMSLFSKAPSSASRHPPSSLGMSSSPPHEPYYEEPMRLPPSAGGLLSPRDWDKKSVASSAAPSAGAPLFSPLNRKSPSLNDLKEDHDPFNYNQWKGNKDPIREFQPIDTDEELSPNMQRAHLRKNTLPRKSMDVDMELQELSEANINRMFSPLDNRVNDGLISSTSSAFKKPTPLRNMNSSPLSSSQSDRTPNSINNLGLRNVSRTENNTPITERESHPSTDATLEISASPYHSQSFPRTDLNNGAHTTCTVSCSMNCPKSPSFKRPSIDSNYQSEVTLDPHSGDYDTLPSDYAPPPGGDWMGSKSTFASEMGSDPLDWKGSALTELTLDDLSQVDDEFSKRNSFLDGPRPKKSGSIPSMATSSRAGTPKNRLASIQDDDTSSVASSKIGNTKPVKNDLGGVKVLPAIPLGRAMLKKTGSKFLT